MPTNFTVVPVEARADGGQDEAAATAEAPGAPEGREPDRPGPGERGRTCPPDKGGAGLREAGGGPRGAGAGGRAGAGLPSPPPPAPGRSRRRPSLCSACGPLTPSPSPPARRVRPELGRVGAGRTIRARGWGLPPAAPPRPGPQGPGGTLSRL